ncbi:hypothetical protein EATG_01574 [Escherichia coli H605]|uniref:Uncharacterized protein n=1 Tax=Escherichia coli H605 TaxID=656410 RepID=A0AAJ3NWG6_ECOLX|nr:hypothetical protein EATG_01574 [Escherichia coli H605]
MQRFTDRARVPRVSGDKPSIEDKQAGQGLCSPRQRG